DRGTARKCELPNAVDRVVVVGRQQISASGRKWKRLADQLAGAARVGGEDDHVLIRRGVQEGQHRATRPLGEVGGGSRGGAVRMRVPECPGAKELLVLLE